MRKLLATISKLVRLVPSFFVVPLARLDAALDKYERSFLQVLLGNFRLFAPNDNLVPFGALLALAIAVLVGFIGGKRKVADGLAGARVSSLRVAAQTSHQNYFVDGHVVSPCAGEDNTAASAVQTEVAPSVSRMWRFQSLWNFTGQSS